MCFLNVSPRSFPSLRLAAIRIMIINICDALSWQKQLKLIQFAFAFANQIK